MAAFLGPLPVWLCGTGEITSSPDPKITYDDLIWMFWNIKEWTIEFSWYQGSDGTTTEYVCPIRQPVASREQMVCPFEINYTVCGLIEWNFAVFYPWNRYGTYAYAQLSLFPNDNSTNILNVPKALGFPPNNEGRPPDATYDGPVWDYGPLPSSGGANVQIETMIYKWYHTPEPYDEISIQSVKATALWGN